MGQAWFWVCTWCLYCFASAISLKGIQPFTHGTKHGRQLFITGNSVNANKTVNFEKYGYKI